MYNNFISFRKILKICIYYYLLFINTTPYMIIKLK